MAAALGAFVVCGVVLALAQRQAALEEAVRDAGSTTSLLATRVVQPALPASPDRLGSAEPLDRVMRQQVVTAPITAASLVDETGLVVQSTVPGATGQRQALRPDELDALRGSTATARRGDGSDPTRLLHRSAGQTLEVSAGLRAPSGEGLLLRTSQPFEVVWSTSQPFEVVWSTSRAVWATLLPSLVLALVLLYLVKIGFTYRLTRNLHMVQEERESLLVTALAAGDRERSLIASDLHDGVVQGLTGASYTLTDTANRVRSAGRPDIADSLADTARSLRQWIRELRSLIVTVTPPALHSQGLGVTLADLVATLEARQIEVDLDVTVGDLPETSESLVYRVAQEAVRNIVRHANASRVQVVAVEDGDEVHLTVTDDGQGFDPTASTRRRGSVGLPLLAALVHERGGHLRVTSATGAGTTVTLRLPRDPARRPGRPVRSGAR